MAVSLPQLSAADFERELAPWLPDRDAAGLLHLHYEELCRWSPRLALIGEGTASEVLSRHYGESLAACEWLPESGRLMDVGSGAGFPGLVLAASRPALNCILVEARLRKAAFLRAAARRMGLAVEVSEVRLSNPLGSDLPDTIDCVTARAVRLPEAVWAGLLERLPGGGSVLLWAGASPPQLPGVELVESRPLAGAATRAVLRFKKP